MSVIYGPLFTGYSKSDDFQRLLASKCRQRLNLDGSMEYLTTWKTSTTPAGRSISQLVVSVRRTNGIDCSGWQTPHCPRQHDSDNSDSTYLGRQVRGWATPKSATGKYQYSQGKKVLNLEGQADLVSGTTQLSSNAQTGNREGYLLNPLFSLYLQGFPAEWAYCVVPEMR